MHIFSWQERVAFGSKDDDARVTLVEDPKKEIDIDQQQRGNAYVFTLHTKKHLSKGLQ